MENSDTAIARLRLTFRGRVQGVGFRWFVRETAQRMGVSGWVRNRVSGEVEIEAQAAPTALSRFIEELKTGHPYAQVLFVESRDIPPAQNQEHFAIY